MISTIVSLVIVSSLFWSCGDHPLFLSLPATNISIEESRFGVVSLPYLGLTSKLGVGDQIVTLRAGDIVKIDAVRMIYDDIRGIWLDHYRVIVDDNHAGWTTSESLELFKYIQTAKNYRKALQAKKLELFDQEF